MQMDPAESLRLVAKDEADLEVVSALLQDAIIAGADMHYDCLLYTSPSPRDATLSRMPSSA